MAEDVTEPQIPALAWQPRAILEAQDYADILEGQFYQWRLRPTATHKYVDDGSPSTDPLEDLIRRGFGA